MFRPTAALFSFALLISTAWAVEKGDVVVIKQNAELRVSGKTVGKVSAGDVHKVHAIRGDWVEVGEKTRGWIRTSNVSTQEDAVAHVTNLLEESPDDAKLHITRARMYLSMRNYEAAEIDLKKAMQFDPANGDSHYYFAESKVQQGNPGEAIASLDKAIELSDTDARYFALRARLLQQRRDIPAARQDFEKVADLGAADAVILNNLAWWYATDPDSNGRNGTKAVKYATKACELTHHKNYMYVDTLAAAYAEFNDFVNAVKYQEEAIELCNDSGMKTQLEARLKQYRLNQPYRETPR